jgi:hypothetical protein
VCVESKQPRKPHKAAEARNLAPLELVHSDLCEMMKGKCALGPFLVYFGD